MAHQSDVLVIGGGVIGLCCAYFLAQRGYRVTVLEKARLGSGCSYGNAGLIVPSHSVPLAAPGVLGKGLRWLLNPESPLYLKPRLDGQLWAWLWRFCRACTARHRQRAMPLLRDLHLASLRLYSELAALEGMDFGLAQRGLLTVCRTPQGFAAAREEAHLLQGIGLEAHPLSAAEVQQHEPRVAFRTVGGVFYPQDAHLDPARFVQALARHLAARGVALQEATEVFGFDTVGSRLTRVKTTRGDFAAEEVVLAGGAWSPQLARLLDLRLLMQPGKGYSLTVRRPPAAPRTPLMLAEARVAVTPMDNVLRFAGTLELAGFDFSLSRRRLAAICRAVPAYMPALVVERLALVEIWRGWRPCTPDGLPYLGRTRRYANLTIATGHAMLGVSLGPITGLLVAQLLSGEAPAVDLTLLRVERFA
ncbi:MAG: D-amino-acid dehydrogenase [Candidatus Tectimicrobiota bacterium]|nr:MAG: D-amino-acid dehydrogenase [Candidatus Tectomicrobia bacterium]